MMIQKGLLVTFMATLLATNAFAYYDFGVVGNTYDIKEKDMMEQIKKIYDSLDKEKLKKEFIEEANKALIADMPLPYCEENSKRVIKIFDKTVPFDFDIPQMDIHIKKGTPITSVTHGIKIKYHLINGNSPDETAWLKKQKVENVILTQGNIRDFKAYPQKYILNQKLQDAFKFKCTPTIFKLDDKNLTIEEFKIKRPLEEEK